MKRILIFCFGLICTSLAVAGDWESVYPGPKAAPRVVDTPKVDPVVTTNPVPATTPATMPTTVTTTPTTKVDAKPTIRVVGIPSTKPATPVITTGDAYPAVTLPDAGQMPLPTAVQTQSQPQVPLTITPKSTYKYVDQPAFQPKPPVITSGDTVSVYPGTAVPITAPVPSGTTIVGVPPVMTTQMPTNTTGTTIPLFGVPSAKATTSVSTVSSIPVSTPVTSVIPTPSLPTYTTPQRITTTTAVDLSQPLPNILTAPLPTTPTTSVLPHATSLAGTCATGTCTTGTCATCDAGTVPCGTPLLQPLLGRSTFFGGDRAAANCGERPTLDRLKAWLCYQPGPSVWPGFTPTPYAAPIRAYFPASENRCATGGTNCAPGQGGNPYAAGNQLQPAVNSGCTGSACRAPLSKGFGLFAHPSSTYATTGPIGVACAPVAVPLPPSCVGSAAPLPCSPRSGCSTYDRLLGFFSLGGCSAQKAWTCPTTNCQNPGQNCVQNNPYATVNAAPPTATVPVIMGYTQPSSGYRFANPIAVPPAYTPPAQNAVPQQNYVPVQQGVTKAPTAPQVLPASAQLSANRPFSNP